MAGALHRRRIDGGVVVLELDNPPMNAMSREMLALARSVLQEVEADETVRAVVLTGRGRAFCSGADLKAARDGAGGEDLGGFGEVVQLLADLRVPVVAAINGHCVGGGLELALCCDLRIASTEARFVCAGVNMGLMASTYRLPRLIGVARAKAMLLTGLPHDAATAEAWGLVTSVHPAADLEAAALALAGRIASRAPLSVEASKRIADRALEMTPAEAQAVLAREIAPLRRSQDHREAVAAFVEKRQPVFARR